MSLTSQHLFTNRITFYFTTTTTTTNIKIPNFSPPITSRHLTFHIPHHKPQNHLSLNLNSHHHHHRLKAYNSATTTTTTTSSNDNEFNFDSILSIAEFLCLVSSTIVSLGFAVNCAISGSKKTVLETIVNSRVLVLGVVMLVSGVVIGAWIRRRQWRRICREGSESVNFVERIEKLEEDLKSSATIIRVLSRQLEKLGIRFRVTRKTLKDPIAETAALAQRNSEATQALAVQEDILEKELGEIQKVLLAMQEQQQKQLELILAIGKTGKLWETRQEPSKDHDTIETRNLAEGVKQMETPKTQALGTSPAASNDTA